MTYNYSHPIHAVIFDCDGVIMDTIPLYSKANSLVMGMDYPDEFQIQVNGLGEYEFAKAVIDNFKLDMLPEEFISRRLKILENLFPSVNLVHGVERLIRGFYDIHLPIAVATSSLRVSHEKKTQNHKEIFSLFNYIVCGDEVSHAKPSPEIFQVASSHLGNFKPENVLVIEDSYSGIKAANAAGMASLFLRTGNEDVKEEMNKIGASPTIIVNNFDEFKFEFFSYQ